MTDEAGMTQPIKQISQEQTPHDEGIIIEKHGEDMPEIRYWKWSIK
jgi:hypothetical protein